TAIRHRNRMSDRPWSPLHLLLTKSVQDHRRHQIGDLFVLKFSIIPCPHDHRIAGADDVVHHHHWRKFLAGTRSHTTRICPLNKLAVFPRTVLYERAILLVKFTLLAKEDRRPLAYLNRTQDVAADEPAHTFFRRRFLRGDCARMS